MISLLSIDEEWGVGARAGAARVRTQAYTGARLEIDAIVVDQAVVGGGPHTDDGDGDGLTVEPVVGHRQLDDRVVALVPLVPDGVAQSLDGAVEVPAAGHDRVGADHRRVVGEGQ